ncbi:hypothetical protein K3495_g4824 [Podosphaera aphanis]|nr:hypothetical protein K3495_g4824 [Podosphaera aphanis]
MESQADYDDGPPDSDEIYPCKGCGDILEEGKAFELAGNRWHLNCFRCNTCGTLLDSDANLLLLGDGSLICNDCTYSCSACNNKIEDLAILTGDQAFCASCFRCRNCKRKIENLRYARTSQGIFCMSCHESLMARRKKKSRTAANAKQRREDHSGHVDKLLPALPPSAALQGVFSADRNILENTDHDTHTELSPRPRQRCSHNDSSSRSSSRRPYELSPERASVDENYNDGMVLPSTTYLKNRQSVLSQQFDTNGREIESFFIPLALDPGHTSELRQEPLKKGKDSKSPESGYITLTSEKGQNDENKFSVYDSVVSNPHIVFREGEPSPSAEEIFQIKDNLWKAQNGSRRPASRGPSFTGLDGNQAQHTTPSSTINNTTSQQTGEKFLSGETFKEKFSNTSAAASLESRETDSSISTLGESFTTLPISKDNSTKENHKSSSPKNQLSGLKISRDNSTKIDLETRPSFESSRSSPSVYRYELSGVQRSTSKKERNTDIGKNNIGILNSSSGIDGPPSPSPSQSQHSTSSLNGKILSTSSAPNDRKIPPRAPTRPPLLHQPHSYTYMSPRPPPPLPSSDPTTEKDTNLAVNNNLGSQSLPRWSQGGGDFTMDEAFARILGDPDDAAHSLLHRVSNTARNGKNTNEINLSVGPGHGRSASENTAQATTSSRWAKSDEILTARETKNFVQSMVPEESALLRKQLRHTEQRVAELENQLSSQKDLQNLIKKVQEKKKAVSALDSQAEVMIRQIEVLTSYLQKAKKSEQIPNLKDIEDSAVKDFIHKLENVKQSVSDQIERLLEDRNKLLDEKSQITADRERALLEFEQLSSRNAQLADLNNDLTHQIQEKFKSHSSSIDSSKPQINGLGIYTHNKDKSIISTQLDDVSLRSSGSNTLYNANSYPHSMDHDANIDQSAVLSAPHVVNIRKGQATKKTFNWKRGRQTVAKGVSKGIKGAFSSTQQQQQQQQPFDPIKWQSQTTDNIGLPYNLTVTAIDTSSPNQPLNVARNISNDQKNQGGFGLFKKSTSMPKSLSNGNIVCCEKPSILFGSDLCERADYERRQIPSVVTRCIEEVELRGMDVEGIYRKTGGNSQVKTIQDGFERMEDYDISDPTLDITAVTSVLKQYLRRLPIPLLTFDVYDRVLESTSIEDCHERCLHLRDTFSMLPPKHRDCLEFLIFHLSRVAVKEKENLMSSKNLAVVFAPTIMRDTSIEREMNNMHLKNTVVQFIIENSYDIFGAP